MESSTPDNTRIFFKDKSNELKGPFTEREVQVWYRKGWFDSSYPFYFMKEGEHPNDDSEFRTLDMLRERNGNGCPFKPIENEEEGNDEKMAEKLIRMEKEIRELSKKCDEFSKMEKRIEELERKLSELSTPFIDTVNGDAVPDSTVETREAQGQDGVVDSAESLQDSATAQLVVFFIDVCEQLWKLKVPEILVNRKKIDCQIPNKTKIVFFKEFVRQLGEKPYLFCGFCECGMFTARQTIMHIVSTEHREKMTEDQMRIIDLLVRLVGITRIEQMFAEALEKVDRQRMRWSRMSLEDPALRPTTDFISWIRSTFLFMDIDIMYEPKTIAERAWYILPRMKADNTVGQNLMKQLEEELGKNHKTRCIHCKLIFANAAEYFGHLITFPHIRNAPPLDLITIVVNVQKGHVARLQPWPEMSSNPQPSS